MQLCVPSLWPSPLSSLLVPLVFAFDLPLSCVYFLLSRFLCSLSSSSFFFFCSFSSNISNAAVLVNKRARGIAFFGALGVDADGTTNRFVRESSFSPPLLRSVGVCPERFGEFELEVSGVAVLKLSSTVTGARGCTVENCSASDNSGSDWKTEVYF